MVQPFAGASFLGVFWGWGFFGGGGLLALWGGLLARPFGVASFGKPFWGDLLGWPFGWRVLPFGTGRFGGVWGGPVGPPKLWGGFWGLFGVNLLGGGFGRQPVVTPQTLNRKIALTGHSSAPTIRAVIGTRMTWACPQIQPPFFVL